MLEDIIKRRDETLALAAGTMENTDIGDARDDPMLVPSIQALRNDKFRIALVAPFTAGKSTFINALLGTDLLSMALLAETCAVTYVRRGAHPRLVVNYPSGESDTVPSDGQVFGADDADWLGELVRRVSMSYETTEHDIQSGQNGYHALALKRILKIVSSVPKDSPEARCAADEIRRYLPRYPVDVDGVHEDRVSDIMADWDFKLCDEGVEYVDTPGLFNWRAKHEEITRKVLPTVQAVLFVIDVDCVGHKQFTEVIRDHVRNAKASNLDEQANHIFFILNKIDQIPPKDLDRQLRLLGYALAETLRGIIDRPQLLPVSSYYALRARQALVGEIELRDLQRDSTIHLVDQDGCVLAGKQLDESHVPAILEASRIAEVEAAIAAYLKTRHDVLVDNVCRLLIGLHTRKIEQVETSIGLAERQIRSAEADISERITIAQERVRGVLAALQSECTGTLDREFERVTNAENPDGVSSMIRSESVHAAGSFMDEIQTVLQVNRDRILPDVRQELQQYQWSNKRDSDYKHLETHLSSMLQQVADSVGEVLAPGLREVAQHTINHALRPVVQRMVGKLIAEFEAVNVQINEILTVQLDIEAFLKSTRDLGIEGLTADTEEMIEARFRDFLTSFDFKKHVGAVCGAASRRTKEGVRGWPVLGPIVEFLFGEGDAKIEIDTAEVHSGLAEIISGMESDCQETVDGAVREVVSVMDANANDVCARMDAQLEAIIGFHKTKLDEYLQGLRTKLALDEEALKASIARDTAAAERLRDCLAKMKDGVNPYAQSGG